MSRFRKSWLSSQISVLVLLLLLHTNLLSATLNISNTDTDTEQERLAILHIIAIVPIVDGIDNTYLSPSKWEQGETILSGAYQAAHEIGNSINGYRFKVTPVRVLQCDLNKGIVPFVEELTSKENHIIGIVGYFCHNIAQHFSEILQHAETSAIQISATSLNGDRVPHIHHSILPVSESTAKALVQLILSLGWRKVAIISSQKVNFLDAKHAFLKEANGQGIKVISQLEINHNLHLNHKDYLDEIQNTGAKIIVGFLPLYKVIDVLCTAYHHGFRWPHYAWIFADLTIVGETPNSFQNCSQSKAVDALTFSGAIFLYFHPGNGFNYTSHSNGSLENFHFQGNSYTSVLYDSVTAIVYALNRSVHILNERNLSLTSVNNRAIWSQSKSEIMEVLEKQLSQLSFEGATGFLNFSHSAAAMQISVKLCQFQDQQLVPIGSYNFSLNQLILNKTIMGEIPTDTLDRIYILYPIHVMVLLLMMILMCFAMTVLSMCLYFYYHKHPSIKATSTTLSLCLFIGCFFLLLSSLFHTINSGIIHDEHGKMGTSYRIFICMFDIYLINIGTDTVLATVIAKTLRIYHIFKKFGKVHQICSDQGLFILILAIVSVKIILLILWLCLDVSLLVDKEQYMKQSVPPYFLVTQKCQNQYPTVWITLQYIYTLVLAFIMVLLAVLTRKIKRGDFKDTKKINMLVVVLVFDLCIFLSLWAILRLIDNTILSKVAYSVGIALAAFLSQVFLILPKIVPLVINDCRCLKTLKSYASTSYSALIKTLDSEVASSS